ncbi:hypothetical protein LTR08_001439 [Meristemomyces frigidus]|nr:hypothetical protein LTR08_001439 [Meristemomyces frigidus]
MESNLSSLCGACIAANANTEYNRASNTIVQEMWRLRQRRAPNKQIEKVQKRLAELEATTRETIVSYPFRSERVLRTRLVAKERVRGSLLQNEVLPESIAAPWDLSREETAADGVEEWKEEETGLKEGNVPWDSDWEAEDVVLR